MRGCGTAANANLPKSLLRKKGRWELCFDSSCEEKIAQVPQTSLHVVKRSCCGAVWDGHSGSIAQGGRDAIASPDHLCGGVWTILDFQLL